MKKPLVLTKEGLKDEQAWKDAGYNLPKYDREEMIRRTKASPKWLHFGAGNIFRAFQANLCQKLLNSGDMDTGIVAVSGFSRENIIQVYWPHDALSVLVTLKSDGSVEKTVIGSVAEACLLDPETPDQFGRLKEVFAAPSLQIASFTITEKGYSLKDMNGSYLPQVLEDFANGPAKPKSYIGRAGALLYARYLAGAHPVALVSMDNCSHNGEKLFASVRDFAEHWIAGGFADPGFLAYVEDPEKVSFPWSMVDKITPRPDPSVLEMLIADHLQDVEPMLTPGKTHSAPFVNAEESEYLVIEDSFPNGRPKLENAGVIFTDRETVNKVERMKVCTCLNPLHTALAVFGCLLGFDKISAEMKDPDLAAMVRIIGYKEGLPTVTDPGVLDPHEFIDTVVGIRFPNPFMPDTPQRIATDTSQKLPIRFGETIKAYAASATLDPRELKLIPFVFAGWIRYLMAVDDDGQAFVPSPDPLLEELQPLVKGFTFGTRPEPETARKVLQPLLTNDRIFGVNLEEAGLAPYVCECFSEMLAGKGSVRKTLHRLVSADS